MAGQCTYFASPAWRARVEATAKEWSMHMFLRFRGAEQATQVRTNRGRTAELQRLAEVTGETPGRLRWTPAWSLWQTYDERELGFTWSEVVETWRDVNALPDEGTADLESACPHEPVTDDRCIFHQPPDEKSDERVAEALVEAVESGVSERRRFDGARFGSLDLSGRTLDAAQNGPIDLRLAVIEGDLALSGLAVPNSMFSMRFATVNGDASFRSAEFGGPASFVGAGFRGNVSFYRARFDSKARFTRTRFGTDARGRTPMADGVRTGDTSDGTTPVADGSTATVEADTRSNPGSAAASSAAGDTATEAVGESERRYATFGKAVFDRKANFHESRFAARANFNAIRAKGPVAFTGTQFSDAVELQDATFEDTVRFADISSARPVDLSRASLAAGTIRFEAPPTRFDLTHAELGTVSLAGNADTYEPVDQLRIHETEFNGFVGAGHREALEAVSWRIHDYRTEPRRWDRLGMWLGLWGSVADDREELASIERTYLAAKRGATADGATTAAGKFFRKEMMYRRLGHARRLRQFPAAKGWVGLYQWLANLSMSATTGHGERPSRVVGSSVLLCAGFAVLYALTTGETSVAANLLFSFQSFVSFIVGPPPVSDTPLFVQAAAAAEGFLGAFFVALFVFTLTRSVHR